MPFKIGLAAVAGLRAATKIVAASNSLDTTSADYVCDGENDQGEINSAIGALGTTGGMVLLLEGTYDIRGSINLASNVALVGQGAGTVLRIPNGQNKEIRVIYGYKITRALVASLRVDGNKANQTTGYMYGIYFNKVSFSEITNCWYENARRFGIYLYFSNDNIVTGNTCRGNSTGIVIQSSDNNTVANNVSHENGGSGIYLNGSFCNTLSGNTCRGNSGDGIGSKASHRCTITGNACRGNGAKGIYLETSHANNITSNTCQANGADGIAIASSHINIVTSNVCRENPFNGIRLYSSNNNNITGNTLLENSQAEDNYHANIKLQNSDYNLISSNVCRRGTKTNKPAHGINIDDNACDRNVVHGNDLYDSGTTGDLNDSGMGTLKRDNRNKVGTGWLVDT